MNQATSNVSKLPNVLTAVSPFASANSGLVSKDGTIAYSSVSWNVNPDSLDTSYLSKLDNAVAPASRPACRSSTAAAPGRSATSPTT